MSEPQIYTVTIRTTCRGCAMALAGYAPRLRTIRAALVTTENEDGGRLTIHSNSATIQFHDGSAFACHEHGVTMDLSREPGQAR